MNSRLELPALTICSKFVVAVMALVAVTGCGPRSDRLEITGMVKLDGVPRATIENGAVIVPQEKGVPPGTYIVEINAPDSKAPPVRPKVAPGEPALPPMAPERVPAEYNSGKHTIEVSADSENHFEFDIETRRVG
jgi:hypothetical protein